MNNKGQFSIIAALLVAIVLVASVMTTYSAIRYNPAQGQPQILSAVDETNQALKQLLGFTVGYYGSVLKVTGNVTYAQQLATTYLNSGLTNAGSIKPEWGLSLNTTDLKLKANWFSNDSYSQGTMQVTYDLNGLGITGISYNASTRLEVQVSNTSSPTQAQFKILTDNNEPLINLGTNNIKFYHYIYGNLTWDFSVPTNIISHGDGTYLVDLPTGVSSNSYVVQIEDTRGLSVLASSFSQFTSAISWNASSFKPDLDFVDNANLNVSGTHSSFNAQQAGPDGVFDTLSEAASGTTLVPSYPTNYNAYGSTTLTSGGLGELTINDGNYMRFQSYPTAFSTTTDTFGFATQGATPTILSNIKGSKFACALGGLANNITADLRFTASSGNFGNTVNDISSKSIVDTVIGQRFTSPSSPVVANNIMAYIDTSTNFGNTASGTTSVTLSNNIMGSPYVAPETGPAQSISAYVDVSSTNRHIKAAIYNTTGALLGTTDEITNLTGGAQWVMMSFSGTKPSLSAGTTYILVVWADQRSNGGANYVNLYYSGTSTNSGYHRIQTYAGSWPTPTAFTVDNYQYCIYASITTAPQSHTVKAAIYTDSPYNLVATSQETLVTNTGWVTFTIAAKPTLSASTNYVLVVWAQSGSGMVNLCYSSPTGGNGRYMAQTYGNWPFTVNPSTDFNQYSIYCTYDTTFNAQAAIYSNDGSKLVGVTEEKTLSTVNGWVTFNFISQPVILSATSYVLVIWSSDTTHVSTFCDSGTGQNYQGAGTYRTWSTTVSYQGTQKYSIYCNYSIASQYNAQIELTGNSTTPFPWNALLWTIDSSTSTDSVSAVFQLYNWGTQQYSSSGDGYMTTTLGPSDLTKPQTISASSANFLNSSGFWKVNITTVKSTSSSFDLNLDFVQYSPDVTNYAVNLQEQWLTVNASNVRQDLCIKTGTMGAEPLLAQVLHGGNWVTLMTLASNCFNNVSLIPYIDSATLTIRLVGSNDTADPTSDTWNIDSVYLQDEPDIGFLLNLQQSTFTIELLQNGTMRWLGQNMQLTTQTLPIPPIPVKAIHLNETVNGVNQEVPFQIEDWASSYQIPLGLTSNSTVFGNRQMIVFLLNNKVTDFTVWWNGSDIAIQTPFAFTNKYFTNDNTNTQTLTNGYVTLLFGSFNVKSTVVGTSTSSTATFMRINQQTSTYGAGLAYVIHHGIVRDVVQQEAEWGNGPTGCPNLYANIVLTLPANTTYYTYQLRIMFINSTQARSITDLSLIQLTTSVSTPVLQTENGTLAGFPILQNGIGTFLNSTIGSWTSHHFSEFISGSKGAGIMFTDVANQRLYAFDSIAGSSTGALKTSSALIELLPVSAAQASFKYPYDITWQGAVVTFDGTTPVCSLYEGTTPAGLWILSEYPPTITITAKS